MTEMETFLREKCISALNEENYEQLLKDATELEKVAKNKYDARVYRGIALYHNKKFKEAKEIFYKLYLEKYVREKKEDDVLLYYLALSNLYFGDVQNAITILRKLEKKDPKNIDFKIFLYLSLNLIGDDEASMMELREALEIDKKKTINELEEILGKAMMNSKLSNASKVLIIEILKRLE